MGWLLGNATNIKLKKLFHTFSRFHSVFFSLFTCFQTWILAYKLINCIICFELLALGVPADSLQLAMAPYNLTINQHAYWNNQSLQLKCIFYLLFKDKKFKNYKKSLIISTKSEVFWNSFVTVWKCVLMENTIFFRKL